MSAAPSFETIFKAFKSLELTPIYLKGNKQISNGDQPETVGLAKDLNLEITRVHGLDWEQVRFKNPVFKETPVVLHNGYFDLYYRSPDGSTALELIAADEEGFPIIETVSFGAVWPPPDYRIDGTFAKLPTIEFEQRSSVRALWKLYDKRPPVPEIVKNMLPAARDIMPAPEAGFPPITDENLALIFDTMKVTQDNVAKVFESRYQNELRYCDAWGKWFHWDSTHWAQDQKLLAFHFCRETARKMNLTQATSAATASFSRGVEAFSRATPVFATSSSDWDRNTFLLNTPAGTIDLATNTIRGHQQSDYITKMTRISPQDKPCPLFERFLKDITVENEGLQEYLQRALGACLSGALQDNFLLFLYGTGQNGKNTLGDLITWILGDYAKVIPMETLIYTAHPQHLTILANLRGLRVAVCSEVSEGSRWNEARIKSLTGDAEISANFMHKDHFEFKRTHKHLVYGNHRPLLNIVDPGIKSRLHIIPFKAQFPPDARDPLMREKLETEAPAILHWLIEGHQRWLEDGYLKKCSAVQEETDSYFEAQSTTDSWKEECCIEDSESRISSRELFQSYTSWKESRGERPMSQTRWGEWMSQQQNYAKVKVKGVTYYRGLALRPQARYEYESNSPD